MALAYGWEKDYGDLKGKLSHYRDKYPLLAREGLSPEGRLFHELAKYLCDTCHAHHIDGAMLRLHNLMMVTEDSVEHARELTEKNGTSDAPKGTAQ